jgi:hypothetical protein
MDFISFVPKPFDDPQHPELFPFPQRVVFGLVRNGQFKGCAYIPVLESLTEENGATSLSYRHEEQPNKTLVIQFTQAKGYLGISKDLEIFSAFMFGLTWKQFFLCIWDRWQRKSCKGLEPEKCVPARVLSNARDAATCEMHLIPSFTEQHGTRRR